MLCILFAGIMQIAANFINDLFDHLKGTDRADRLGPERACAKGWITPHAMRIGIGITIAAACATGLMLLPYGGITLVWIGAACVVFAFLYTTLLSYIGMGDVLVWVFFGLVPVAATYYVQTGSIAPQVWWAAAGCGLSIDTLLILNNYRDRHTDASSGKRTIIVVLGERFGSLLYLSSGIASTLCAATALHTAGAPAFTLLLPCLYLPMHITTWRTMTRINQGRALNSVLAKTSVCILVYGITLSIGFLM